MNSENRIWGRLVEDCRLSISLSASTMEMGQTVQLSLVLRNDGATDISYPRFSQWFEYEYRILYDGNQEVPLTQFGEQQKRSSMILAMFVSKIAPGQEMTSTVEISRLYNLGLPGNYVIEATRELPRRGGQGFMKIISNRLELEIIRPR